MKVRYNVHVFSRKSKDTFKAQTKFDVVLGQLTGESGKEFFRLGERIRFREYAK